MMTRRNVMKGSGSSFKRPAMPTSEERRQRSIDVLLAGPGRAAVMGGNTTGPVPKGPAAKPGKGAPTVEEKRWLDAIVAFGCIACYLDMAPRRDPAVHHILRGGRRMGHMWSIGLCDPGHHQGGQPLGMISRHPWKSRFEERYGTELELLARLRAALGYEGPTPC